MAGYLTAVFLVLSWPRALAFLAVQQGLFGLYLGCAFAPNHKGMPVLSEQDNLDFLRRQVLTSRNVSGGRLTETMLGGLNYQIEHHLFPAMPRPSLRRCRILVRAFCAQTGLLYCETGLVSSYSRCCAIFMRPGSEGGYRALRLSPCRPAARPRPRWVAEDQPAQGGVHVHALAR